MFFAVIVCCTDFDAVVVVVVVVRIRHVAFEVCLFPNPLVLGFPVSFAFLVCCCCDTAKHDGGFRP